MNKHRRVLHIYFFTTAKEKSNLDPSPLHDMFTLILEEYGWLTLKLYMLGYNFFQYPILAMSTSIALPVDILAKSPRSLWTLLILQSFFNGFAPIIISE